VHLLGGELAAALTDRILQSRPLYVEIVDIVAGMAAHGVAAEVGYLSLECTDGSGSDAMCANARHRSVTKPTHAPKLDRSLWLV
jgi:hypothetical protein